MPTDDLVEPDTRAPACPQTGSAPTAPPGGPRRASLSPLALRLHFYAGIFVAPLLLVAAATGLLYVFTPQLEQAVYRHELHVPKGEVRQPLTAQLEAARAVHPQGSPTAVRPGAAPTDTTRVIYEDPDLPESYFRTVFVDPYTLEVRGQLETYGSGSQGLPVRGWTDVLHRSLHLGDPGRIYSELAASWLWVVGGGGLVLWWARRRPTRRFRFITAPDLKATGRRRTMSWHGAVGTWAALVPVLLSATGLTWSQFAGENVTALREAMSWTTPSVSTSAPHHGDDGSHAAGGHDGGGNAAGGSATDVGADEVLAAARGADLDGPVQLNFPVDAESAYVVEQIKQDWPVGADSAAIDPATGEVTDTLRFADYPLMAKLSTWGINAHMGLLFGLPNQLALAAVAVALITMIILGYRMWWQRRPTKAFGVGRPIARGAWRKVAPGVLVPLAAATLLIAWFLPLFGLSLAAFLVIDAAVGWRAARRPPGTAPAA